MVTAPTRRDYSLIGLDAEAALASGLASAEWYKTDIPRKRMKELMQRSDGPPIRDTIIWLLSFVVFGVGGYVFWGSWWAVPFFICYGVLYGSSTDSRWHECGHGTAFRTRSLNDAVYHLACFMIMREPTIWRWSHTRHHTDTLIVGRDPEIAAMRPPAVLRILSNIFAVSNTWSTVRQMILHAAGRLDVEERTFVPELEWGKVFLVARIWLAIHLSVIALALLLGSWLPLIYVGVLPTMYGGWMTIFFGLTQHAGLAENVLDHRLNSRTVYMNPIFRFLYWNMNYHVEHHMFPMVPYHRLPELHEVMKADMPKPYASTIEAYREIIPALLRQIKDPEYYVKRELPASAKAFRPELHASEIAAPAE
ncbi:fatty acid desaturase family protein [Sinorhizobium numidicum]|uniref:Fatty acid desaturase family protein n=1 Tax=Sinorhizobium numidicum TaxID=680248 RepID=A0ABY8CRG2_9HYPH|nr:fatty acid desaturase family protein [Sinorhizobium numidicum]WEX75249.1 fatty acid desaturase family protein [Sinorhizobium numidicum]WEX81244.1 fatty acid desaturase family protein [Sinorhizobium numidicum]